VNAGSYFTLRFRFPILYLWELVVQKWSLLWFVFLCLGEILLRLLSAYNDLKTLW